MIQENAEEKPEAQPSADLFLSYNRADTEAVQTLRTLIQGRGVGTFFDRDQLLVGMPWPQALEKALRGARGVAVFIGPGGLGLWQKREMAFALDRQVSEEKFDRPFPVIPVLLPGADITPGFLFLNTWVDLREDLADSEALDTLVAVVRGEKSERRQEAAGALCPYQGLRPFDEESAAFFFGRESLSNRLMEALLSRNLVAVIGPSGSGKSSIVQAGVLPLLRRQRPPAATWDAIGFIPGDRPFHHLAAALMPLLEPALSETERLSESQKLADLLAKKEAPLQDVVERVLAKSEGTDRLLLVADQFEELFTLTSEQDRLKFLAVLVEALDRSRLNIVLTMRGSFYDRLIGANRGISDRLEHATVNLGPMTREELHQAIVGPARRIGLNFEPGLAKRILDDVGNEPGNLPLLEFALTELWARREGRLLTHAAYEQIDGVTGAIVQRAEGVFQGFTAAQRDLAKRLLIRLVWVGVATETPQETRQRLRLAELDQDSLTVIQSLANARLLVLAQHDGQSEHTAEVAHEALIRRWARLREWLDEDREFLLWRRRLRAAQEIWDRNGDEEAGLMRGTPLREAEAWLMRREEDLAADEREFIRASLALGLRERIARERRKKRVILASTGLALTFLVLATVAVMKSLASISQEFAAHARSQLDIDPEQAVLLGIEAVKMHFTDEAEDILKVALQRLLLVSRSENRAFLSCATFSPDGKTIAAIGDDKIARAWSWDGKRFGDSRLPQKLPNSIHALAFSPDGSRIAVAKTDTTAGVVDTKSGRVLSELRGHTGQVVGVAFSPADNGKLVATAGQDATARLWDAETGRALNTLKGHQDKLTSVAFGPDGRTIVTASLDTSAIIWDTDTGRQLHRLFGHTAPVTSAEFSPDGKLIVTASHDNTAIVWDARTGKSLAQLTGHVDSLTDAAFSPTDPGLLVTASRDQTARVWKRIGATQSWQNVTELRGHTHILTSAAFSPDGKHVVTASRDRTVRVWDAMSEQAWLGLFGHTGSVDYAAFSPDGRRLISSSSDNTARLWSANGGSDSRALNGHKSSLNSVSFSPDGELAVSGSDDNTALIWDTSSGKILQRLIGHDDTVNGAAFDPGGTLVVTASDDATARIWDAKTGKTLRVLDGGASRQVGRPRETTPDIAFSPDGARVATIGHDPVARLQEVGSGRILAELRGHRDLLTGVSFSPRGDRLATTSRDGTVRLWDARTGEGVAELSGHGAAVTGASFSPDGALLVTASDDRTARLWATATGAVLGSPLLHAAPVTKAEFTADGNSVATTTFNHEVRLWDLASGRMIGKLCADCSPLSGHSLRLNSASFSPDGKLVVTASRDGTARVWDGESGRVLSILEGHTGPVMSAVFSPDGNYILTASRDQTARLWRREIETFEPLFVLKGHDDELTGAVFSPDGQLIATASRDATARVWETATGKPIHVLRAHREWLYNAEFSPDSRLLVTSSRDTTAIIWNVQDGTEKFELRGHLDAVKWAGFNRDGDAVVTASQDQTLRIWNLKDIEEKKVCPICSGSIEEICKLAHQRTQRTLTPDEREQYHVPWFTSLFSFRCPK